jgi:hypothetical protein
MKNKREVTWYIFTNDGHTNEVIARELIGRERETESANYPLTMCADGIERPLWECSGAFVTLMKQNGNDPNLHFKIFKKEGKYGPIREVKFIKRPKKKRNYFKK